MAALSEILNSLASSTVSSRTLLHTGESIGEVGIASAETLLKGEELSWGTVASSVAGNIGGHVVGNLQANDLNGLTVPRESFISKNDYHRSKSSVNDKPYFMSSEVDDVHATVHLGRSVRNLVILGGDESSPKSLRAAASKMSSEMTAKGDGSGEHLFDVFEVNHLIPREEVLLQNGYKVSVGLPLDLAIKELGSSNYGTLNPLYLVVLPGGKQVSAEFESKAWVVLDRSSENVNQWVLTHRWMANPIDASKVDENVVNGREAALEYIRKLKRINAFSHMFDLT